MRKQLFTMLFALLASVGTIFAQSGTCGADLTWVLQDSILTISGTGEMYNYDNPLYTSSKAPWLTNYIGTIRAPFKEVIILDGVTSIGGCAFYSAQSLLSITIPNSVTSIGQDAFNECTSLTSISIPDNVTNIGEYAFYGCSSLTSVEIPNSVTSIGEFAFRGCSSLPVVDDVRYADSYLVEAVDKTLSSYSIKEGTKWIGSSAFGSCSSLISITIPNSVISVGRYAFYGCSSLPIVDNVRYADSYLVEVVDKTLPSYTIREGTKWIGEDAFSGCSNLASIAIPSSVIYIGSRAYYQCSSLRIVSSESPIPPIMQYAVRHYNDPSVYTRLYYYIFEDCFALEEIYAACGSLEAYKSADGWRKYASKIKYEPYPVYTIEKIAENGNIETSSTEFTVCDEQHVTCTATPIKGCYFVQWADRNTDNPRTIELTQDTTMEAVFDYQLNGKCGKDGVLTWTFDPSQMALDITGKGALSENYTYGTFIESLTIDNEVTTIGQSAFYGCNSLKNVILGSSVKVLEGNAFYGCSAIETITCYSQRPPTVNNYALYGLDYSTIVYVPADYLNTYKMHDAWGLYDVRPLETPTEIETGEYNIRYIDMSDVELYQENVILHIPVAPTIEGFTFLYWQPVAQNLETGITIQAIYEADELSTMPAVYTSPTNPSQKLIRNGNIYILTEDKTYTITGAEVK